MAREWWEERQKVAWQVLSIDELLVAAIVSLRGWHASVCGVFFWVFFMNFFRWVRWRGDAQLAALRVDHDEQVALVGDPDDDVTSREWGFQSVIGTVILIVDQGERHRLESANDIHMGLVREKTVGRVLSPVSSASCTTVGSKMHCMITLCGCSGHALHTMKGRENVCSMPFHPDMGGHAVWTPKHGVNAESMGVSCATGAFGKEKVFSDYWECGSSCQITEANLTWAVAAGAAGAEMVARTAEAKRQVAVVGDGAVVMASRTGKGSGKAGVAGLAGVKTEGAKVTAVVMTGNTEAMVMAGGTGTLEVTMGKGEAYGSNGR
ncbi:hypothetical protein F5148DRAFT_1150556 [Russula earlei]|uniref:Uncharacterized protein n=1 Tax=Russula earlei TaxID=71964 RepID=A0ACC0U3R7_9AGAM|nr:hypothetical protein F5148DRAFT_1150556 [Russula earlei]